MSVILQEEEKLLEIVQLVGNDALPDRQQATLLVARIIREGFLQQNAFHEMDSTCSLRKSYLMMKAILHFSRLANQAVDSGTRLSSIANLPSREKLLIIKYEKDAEAQLEKLIKTMDTEFLGVIKSKEHSPANAVSGGHA
jgi:V/A-type H+-transporting ATPase subunit A